MDTAWLPKPINRVQEEFQRICKLGGGPCGGPARTRVQALLKVGGAIRNRVGQEDVAAHLQQFSDRSPWHVYFALGLCWGNLAKSDPDFVDAATRVLAHWNDADLKAARHFHYERGPDAIEYALRLTCSSSRRSPRISRSASDTPLLIATRRG